MPVTYLKSFGKLLRRLRGKTPIAAIAERSGIGVELIAGIEASHTLADEPLAKMILTKGFSLEAVDVRRLILGVQFFDLGLRDNDFRQLTIDLLLGVTPEATREEIRRLYRTYSGE